MWGALVICCIIYAYIGVNDNELGLSIKKLIDDIVQSAVILKQKNVLPSIK